MRSEASTMHSVILTHKLLISLGSREDAKCVFRIVVWRFCEIFLYDFVEWFHVVVHAHMQVGLLVV